MVPNDKTNFEGAKIDTPTGHIGLHRITKKLPQIFDGSSSCVNLIFTFQRNLVMKLGTYASLQTNCHHQAIYAKILSSTLMRGYYGKDKRQCRYKCFNRVNFIAHLHWK